MIRLNKIKYSFKSIKNYQRIYIFRSAPPPDAIVFNFNFFNIDQVVATEAESVGNPEIFSIFSMAGSDGI
jgi:hypothetical protein